MIPYLIVVAANNNEDVSWTSSYPVCINFQYHPPGRESHTFLDWILTGDMVDEVVFCQGNPFYHDPDFLSHIENPVIRHYGPLADCDRDAGPSYTAPMHSWCDVLGLEKRILWQFSAGSQYRVHYDQIRNHSLEFYRALLSLTYIEPKSPWILERLWPLIWKINL